MRHRRTAPRPGTPASGGFHYLEWACELVGTAILIVGGLSAVCVDFGRGSEVAHLIPSTSARLAVTGIIFAGVGSLVAVSPLGRRSGAHLNPAVTLAFFLRRHVHRHDLAGYVAAQCIGGLAGTLIVRGAWGAMATSVQVGLTTPGHGATAPGAVALEAAMTGALVFVILWMVSSPRRARFTPLAVWVVVAALVWQGAPFTGTSLNPARSLGPAIVTDRYGDLWVYVVGPLCGTVAAVGLFGLVPGLETLTAKLFHDPSYPSTMASALPVAPRR